MSTQAVGEIKPKIVRTSKGLIDAMFDEFDDLNSGKSTPQNARAKASMANTICQITRLQMDHSRFVTDARKGEGQLGDLQLGSSVAV